MSKRQISNDNISSSLSLNCNNNESQDESYLQPQAKRSRQSANSQNYHLTSSNTRVNSKKASQLFACTVPYTQVNKQQVFADLEEMCFKLLIAQENHFDGTRKHHHIYMRTKQKFTVANIKHVLKLVYDLGDDGQNSSQSQPEQQQNTMSNIDSTDFISGQIYVSTVRNEDQYVRYITKEDFDPLFKGLNDKKFSFGYQSTQWSTQSKKFHLGDTYVLNHANQYKFLRELHAEKQRLTQVNMKYKTVTYQRQNALDSPCLPVYDTVAWLHEVKDWWNDWIANGYEHKKKQLYLYGPSNVGKTSFIHHLLSSCIKYENNSSLNSNTSANRPDFLENMYKMQIFMPTPNEFKYAWQSFDEDIHKLVVIDEFDVSNYEVTDLKKALAGETFVANIKGSISKIITLRIPVILISNLEPPSDTISSKYQGIQERLRIVNARHKIY